MVMMSEVAQFMDDYIFTIYLIKSYKIGAQSNFAF